MAELTDLEQQFFATGVLPPELVAPEPEIPQQAAPIADPVTQTPAPKTEVDSDLLEMLRRSLSEEQNKRADAEARFQQLEQQSQQRQQQVTAPDPNTDPLGAMMHQLQQVTTNVESLKQQLTQEQQNNLLKQQFTTFTQSISQIKDAYAKTVPDFDAAYAHVRSVRTEDLLSVGIKPDRIPQILLQDELAIAQNAISAGKNPAEELYKMSKRYGYQPKTGTRLTPEQKITNVAKGVESDKNITRAAPDTELTLESLKDAGDSDLSKIVQDDKLWAKLVGGSPNDIF
jgi:hypothetical protein